MHFRHLGLLEVGSEICFSTQIIVSSICGCGAILRYYPYFWGVATYKWKVVELLLDAPGRISLTWASWTSVQSDNSIVIPLSGSTRIGSGTLGAGFLSNASRYSWCNAQGVVLDCVQEFKIESNILACTTNGGGNMRTCFEQLQLYLQAKRTCQEKESKVRLVSRFRRPFKTFPIDGFRELPLMPFP